MSPVLVSDFYTPHYFDPVTEGAKPLRLPFILSGLPEIAGPSLEVMRELGVAQAKAAR
jgi:hypothetical protein